MGLSDFPNNNSSNNSKIQYRIYEWDFGKEKMTVCSKNDFCYYVGVTEERIYKFLNTKPPFSSNLYNSGWNIAILDGDEERRFYIILTTEEFHKNIDKKAYIKDFIENKEYYTENDI